jgi:MFS family permease
MLKNKNTKIHSKRHKTRGTPHKSRIRIELNALYSSYFIKLFGESFVSVFTAIYLLANGFDISQVARFYIIYFAVALMFRFVARGTMKRYGIIHTMAAGIVGYMIYYYFLRNVTTGLPYEGIAVIYGMASGLYFSAFAVSLARALRGSSKEGAAVAMVRAITVLSGVIGPFVGAVFAVNLSFELLFACVAVIFMLSLLPLLYIRDRKLNVPAFSWRRALRYDSAPRALVYIFNGATTTGVDILWPAFIYLNYKNFIAVGGIVSATSLFMAAAIYVIGKSSDLNIARSYKIGVLTHAPTWLIRLVLLSPGGLLISNLLSTVTAYLIDIPLNKAIYHSAKNSDSVVDYFIFVEFCNTIGRIGLLAFVTFTQNIEVVFSMISVLTLLHLMLLPELGQTKSKHSRKTFAFAFAKIPYKIR